MTYTEAAEYLGVPKSTLRKWVASKRLPVIRYGHRTVRFNLVDLKEFRDSHTVKARV
tara:strand:+ start:724 stop:894 length:171 start_codon:yes stop_codon:yes gene_type:complete